LSSVLLLTSGPEPPADILPSLTLLPHVVRIAPPAVASVGGSQPPDAVLVDARRDLVQAKRLVQALRSADRGLPVLVIVTEGGWAALAADWGADDVVLAAAGPGEVDARLRLAIGRAAGGTPDQSGEIRSGDLVINEATYSARMKRRSLDLTFKEFELLKFLAQQPGRVFTRAQLLQEVWGYDYFGGTRTVDVHVRRLRAKLGAEHEDLIGTVRNVGYRFVPARAGQGRAADSGEPSGGPEGGAGPGLVAPGGPEPGPGTAGEVPDGPAAGGDGRPGQQQPDPRALASRQMTAAARSAPHAAPRPQSGTTARRTAGAER
jgi:DNA-binding response OmpR family regulator